MEPISTALVAGTAKAAVTPIATLIKKVGPEAYAKLTAHFEKCFQGHVESTLDRCSKMKNILYKDNAVDFLSQYVNIYFTDRGENLLDENALMHCLEGNKILISGTAGAGKTMFLRWSAIELAKKMKNYKKIPLFLEMRYFQNEFSATKIKNY